MPEIYSIFAQNRPKLSSMCLKHTQLHHLEHSDYLSHFISLMSHNLLLQLT